MPDKPRITPGPLANNQFEEWIDRMVREGRGAVEVAGGIAFVTQPGGMDGYEVSPELVGNEGWLWPWNRAGFHYLQLRRPIDAATIFTSAYLALKEAYSRRSRPAEA
jgi:hypothetical protein